ncbi:hypothetical protein PBI_MIMI_3 [Arthrobacter phage Mimi]|nr:hypothetical protein PBI_MIMI_82 [Arthrobacter phage Mimi]
MNKFHSGDWVYNENYGAGKVTVAIDHRYTVKFNGEWRSIQLPEAKLTKIEHSLRPDHKVAFDATYSGVKDTTGTVVKLVDHNRVEIEPELSSGVYTRYVSEVTKLADLTPQPDLPLPPKFDTLGRKTVTTTFTDVDPEVMKIVFGVDLAAPKPTKRIQESRDALDRQIKDAEAELAKLRAARRAL